nr:IS30 family transposase [Mycoplasmopsis bovis]
MFKFTSNFEYAEFEKFFLEKFDKRFYGIVATARYIKQTFPNIASPSIRTIWDSHYVYPIWARPKYIDLREEYGHWESDLIIGKRSNGYDNVLTLVERQTRMGFAVKIKSKSAFLVISKLKKIIQDHNLIVKSITIDNGIEFERMGLLGKWLNIKIFRAEPYASFQRASKLLIQTDYRIFEKLQSWSNKWYRMKKTQGVEICSRPCGIVRNIALH